MKKTYKNYLILHFAPLVVVFGIFMIWLVPNMLFKSVLLGIGISCLGIYLTVWGFKSYNFLLTGKPKICRLCNCDIDDQTRVETVVGHICADCDHRYSCKVKKD